MTENARPSPLIEVHDDDASLATAVAGELLNRIADAQAAGRIPDIGLTGGSIAETIHREIARLAPASGVDWGAVRFWFGDERFVPSDSPDRNAGQARAAFLDEVGATRVHEVPGSDRVATAEDAAAAYATTIRSEGEGFDVLMLGVGPDGHVASLFPGHPRLAVTDAIATAVHDSPKPPPDRVSLTFEALNDHTQAVWFVVSGEGKADAVARALAEHGDVSATPARGVTGQQETIWFVDSAAASRI